MKLYRGDSEQHQHLWSQERGWYYDPPWDLDWPNRKLRRTYPPATLAQLREKRRVDFGPRWPALKRLPPSSRKEDRRPDSRDSRVRGHDLRLLFTLVMIRLQSEVPPWLWGMPYHHSAENTGTWLGLKRT